MRQADSRLSRLKDEGTPIRANDLWIACHALAEGATLVTHNTREFERVSGLVVEDWALPPVSTGSTGATTDPFE